MSPDELVGGDVRLVPLGPEHVEVLRRIRAHPDVERWWDPVEPGFPLTDDPGVTRYAIEADGVVVGMIQYGEELEPKYRSAWIDIFLDPEVRGRGLGASAVRLLADFLLGEGGHHRITIDPGADNLAAIRAYAKAGFVEVGRMRLAERDPYDHSRWHDSLLMERVVEPGR